MYIICGSIFLILLNNYLKNNYSNKYNEILYNISYKLIYMYSKCQIYCNNIILKLPSFFTKTKDDTHYFEFVLDGKVVYKGGFDHIINSNKDLLPDKYDFIIYSHNENTDNINQAQTNKKILKNIPSKKEDLDYENSKIKFISSEIEINNKKYIISFKNDSSNYYIKNNIFDIKFLRYFLLKYHPDNVTEEDFKNIENFKIHIIDHNVNFGFSDSNNLIKIGVHDYEKIENKKE